MPIVSMKETLGRALEQRYGVPAFNIINDLTIEAVLAAATAERSPVILQTSVKTVRMYGRRQARMFPRTAALLRAQRDHPLSPAGAAAMTI